MVVTFPQMGTLNILAKSLLDDLKIPYVMPPACTQRTLELGSRYAPEQACLPFKINLGNFLESAELGADTVLITGGCGPCRFGYYGQLEGEILKDLGYDMEMIVLDAPKDRAGMRTLLGRLGRVVEGRSLTQCLRAVREALKVSQAVDGMEELALKVRARERKAGTTDRILQDFERRAFALSGSSQLLWAVDQTLARLQSVPLRPGPVLKVGIVGEIFTMLEPFTNLDIPRMLGQMGVEVSVSMRLSSWITDHILKLKFWQEPEIREAARPYLRTFVGGHAQETLGHAIRYAKEGYDGIIQLFPLTCLPEIVAESILPSVSEDYGIPLMVLVTDEMSGRAGYRTRLEAFVDMLEQRKEKEHVSWY
jgi:predicted nucleotide-binding protein (sugar kinase/HSP70/actin superfamily)